MDPVKASTIQQSGILKPESKKKDKSETQGKSVSKSSFEKLFKKMDSEPQDIPKAEFVETISQPENREKLLDEIFILGEKLKKEPNLASLEAYKKSVRLMMTFILKSGYDVTEDDGVLNPRTMQRKKYMNIDIIDKKLNDLGSYIMNSQRETMQVISSVDEINGILINIIR